MSHWALPAFVFAWAALEFSLLPRRWSAPLNSRVYRIPSYWQWSEEAWFGLKRGNLISPFWILLMGLMLTTPNLAFGIAFGLGMVLFTTVFLFNRPRSLVPPVLRGQPSFVTHLWRAHASHEDTL